MFKEWLQTIIPELGPSTKLLQASLMLKVENYQI